MKSVDLGVGRNSDCCTCTESSLGPPNRNAHKGEKQKATPGSAFRASPGWLPLTSHRAPTTNKTLDSRRQEGPWAPCPPASPSLSTFTCPEQKASAFTMTALRWTVLACALTCLCLASVGSNAVLVHIDGILALNGSRATAPFSYAAGSAGSQSGGDASEGAAYAVPSSHDTSSLVFKFEDAVGSTGLTPKATAYDDVCAPKVKLRAVTQDKTSFEFIVNYNCMYKGSCFLNVMAGRPDREVIDVRWLKECAGRS